MCTVGDIYNYIDKFAPFESCAEWDNVGLLVGDKSKAVKRAAVALDITPHNVMKAAEAGCNLIISHHPVIFHPIKALNSQSASYLLAKYDISAICAHTNLDAAAGGVNDVLANVIGLRDVRPIYSKESENLAFGRLGVLTQSIKAKDFAQVIKEHLGAPRVDFTCGDKEIKTVAVSSGSGADLYIDFCIESNIDAFVTSEIKHHQCLEAVQAGLCIIDAGHFCTERIICKPLADMLSAAFSTAEFVILDEVAPYQSL